MRSMGCVRSDLRRTTAGELAEHALTPPFMMIAEHGLRTTAGLRRKRCRYVWSLTPIPRSAERGRPASRMCRCHGSDRTRHLKPWFADRTEHPGQDRLGPAEHRLAELLSSSGRCRETPAWVTHLVTRGQIRNVEPTHPQSIDPVANATSKPGWPAAIGLDGLCAGLSWLRPCVRTVGYLRLAGTRTSTPVRSCEIVIGASSSSASWCSSRCPSMSGSGAP
jgi:hypothetical protein